MIRSSGILPSFCYQILSFQVSRALKLAKDHQHCIVEPPSVIKKIQILLETFNLVEISEIEKLTKLLNYSPPVNVLLVSLPE